MLLSLDALLAVFGLLLPIQDTVDQFTASELVEIADRYCISPDGDHSWTLDLALHNEYQPLTPDLFENLRLPGARQLRGVSRTIGGSEVRILTAKNRIRYGGVTTYFHVCWVAADPASRRDVDSEVRRFLDVGRFRQEGALVYAWLPQPDGTRRTVRRKAFELQGFALSRDQGMRLVLTNQYLDQVSITYMRPVESCEEWCY